MKKDYVRDSIIEHNLVPAFGLDEMDIVLRDLSIIAKSGIYYLFNGSGLKEPPPPREALEQTAENIRLQSGDLAAEEYLDEQRYYNTEGRLSVAESVMEIWARHWPHDGSRPMPLEMCSDILRRVKTIVDEADLIDLKTMGASAFREWTAIRGGGVVVEKMLQQIGMHSARSVWNEKFDRSYDFANFRSQNPGGFNGMDYNAVMRKFQQLQSNAHATLKRS